MIFFELAKKCDMLVLCTRNFLFSLAFCELASANFNPCHTLFTLRKQYRIWNKNYPACCNPTNYKESSRSSLDFSRLLRHAIEKGRGPILYGKKKKKAGPLGETSFYVNKEYDGV